MNRSIIKVTLPIIIVILLSQAKKIIAQEPWEMPNIYEYRKHSDLWDITSRNDYYKMMGDWYVYADKEGVKLYDTETDSYSEKTVSYLERFTIYNKKGRRIFIKNSKKTGWANIENFILLPHALKTEHSVTQKAILITKVDDPEFKGVEEREIKDEVKNNDKSRKIIKVLNTYKSPETLQLTGNQINFLEFAFIYQYYYPENDKNSKAGFVLLGKWSCFDHGDNTNEKIKDAILGWVSTKHILNWNTREAFQPNPERLYPVYYFKYKKDIIEYYKNHKTDHSVPICKDVPSCKNDKKTDFLPICPDKGKDQINREEWPPSMPRYIILDEEKHSSIFKIGIPSTTIDTAIVNQIIEELGIGTVNNKYYNYNKSTNTSSIHQLMPGIVKQIIIKLGTNKLQKRKYSTEDVIKVGSEQLYNYVKSPATFYITAYVTQEYPGYNNSPPLLNKMLLFEKREIYRLLMVIIALKDIGGNFNNLNLKSILKSNLKSWLIALDELGLLREIDKKHIFLSKQQPHHLKKYFKGIYNNLNEIYHTPNYFRVFGREFIWVESSKLYLN